MNSCRKKTTKCCTSACTPRDSMMWCCVKRRNKIVIVILICFSSHQFSAMHINYHYETVSEAIEELRKKGYTTDFNLEENCIVCHAGEFYPDDFEVTEVYRYEGES